MTANEFIKIINIPIFDATSTCMSVLHENCVLFGVLKNSEYVGVNPTSAFIFALYFTASRHCCCKDFVSCITRRRRRRKKT